MTDRQLRSGTYAVIDGVTWPGLFTPGSDHVVLRAKQDANPEPSLFEWNATHSLWVARVPWERCDRIYSVATTARWRGHRVVLESRTGDTAAVRYDDTNGGWAVENGFTQVDKYEYRRDVPAAELVDVAEVQQDLAFEQWRARFPAPDGVSTGWRS